MNEPNIHYGAQSQLATQIQTHLFLLCPNNSGSTFLIRVIENNPNIWSLIREGQHVPGYAGPRARGSNMHLRWASTPEERARYRDSNSYDWNKIKQAWYFQATASNKDATIFATKAPPFLLIADMLEANFSNPKFIIMVRNPYAMAEGIMRRYPSSRDMLIQIATHILNCFEIQAENIEKLKGRCTFFTYEEMCAEPEKITKKIQTLEPTLQNLEFDKPVPVKGLYNEPLTNFNARQIEKISKEQIDILNEEFSARSHLIERFGYSLL